VASAVDTVRASLEATFNAAWGGATSIAWGDRPFSPPNAAWVRVSVLFGDAFLGTIGAGGLNTVTGVLVVDAFAPKGAGRGELTRTADDARNAVTQLELSTVTLGVPSGPVPVDRDPLYAMASVSVPFRAEMT